MHVFKANHTAIFKLQVVHQFWRLATKTLLLYLASARSKIASERKLKMLFLIVASDHADNGLVTYICQSHVLTKFSVTMYLPIDMIFDTVTFTTCSVNA